MNQSRISIWPSWASKYWGNFLSYPYCSTKYLKSQELNASLPIKDRFLLSCLINNIRKTIRLSFRIMVVSWYALTEGITHKTPRQSFCRANQAPREFTQPRLAVTMVHRRDSLLEFKGSKCTKRSFSNYSVYAPRRPKNPRNSSWLNSKREDYNVFWSARTATRNCPAN